MAVAAAAALPACREWPEKAPFGGVSEAGKTSAWPVGWQAHMILRGGRPSYFRGKERKGGASLSATVGAFAADDGDAGDGS